MKKLLSNYKSTIILLVSIIIGAIVGFIFKEKATVLSPLGDIFLNLLLVVITPLIFLTITTSISKMKSPKRLGKIVGATFLVFIITSIIAVLIGFASTYFIKLVKPEDGEKIKQSLQETTDEETQENEEIGILKRTASLLTVNDFTKLLSKDNIIALLVFSIIFGLAINVTGEKAKPVVDFLESANEIINNVVKLIMYYAPIGLGCYFAALVGSFGEMIVVGYLKTFVIYTIVSILYFLIIYSI